MARILKISLAASLLLNVGFVIGFFAFKNYVKSQTFKLAAISAQAEAKLLKNILSDLESSDSTKIEILKQRLRKNIENAQNSSSIWQQASGIVER